MSGTRSILLAIAALVVIGALFMWDTTRSEAPAAPEAEGKARELLDELKAAVDARPDDAQAWAELAGAHHANGRLESARTCYERAVELEQDEPSWWYRLALVRNRLGNEPGAVADLERARRRQEYAPAYWRAGLWRLAAGDAEAAKTLFHAALEVDAEDRAARLGIARALLAQGKPEQAGEYLRAYLKDEPRDRYARALLDHAYERRDSAQGTSEPDEPPWPDPWREEIQHYRRGYGPVTDRARELAALGRWQQAIAELRWLLKAHPEDAPLHNQLAELLLDSGQTQQAVAVLQRAVEADPQHFDTHVKLAIAYKRAGAPANALQHAERAIAIKPTSAEAHEARGVALMGDGKQAQAITAFEEALRHEPGRAGARMHMGLAYCDLEKWDQGVAALEEALRRNATLAAAHLGVAVAYMELGAFDKAKRALQQVAIWNPTHPYLNEARARLIVARMEAEKKKGG